MTIEDQLTQWYGKPRQRNDVPATDWCLIGNTVGQIRLASPHVAAGGSVSIITDGQHVHWFVPHPANTAVAHGVFFHAVNPSMPVSGGPPLSEIWNNRGLVLYELGWKLEALECFCRSVAEDPHNGSPWVNFGRAFMEPEVADYAFADVCCLEATALNPQLDMAWANRALIKLTQRQVDRADEYGAQALALNSDNGYAHLALGQVADIRWRSVTGKAQLAFARKALWHFRRVTALLGHPDIMRTLMPRMALCEAILHPYPLLGSLGPRGSAR